MNLREVCRAINKHENYLAVMKKVSPDKFNYMINLDKNPITAYYKSVDEQQDVISRLNHIYYKKSENKGEMEKLYRFMVVKKFFSNEQSARVSFGATILRYSPKEMRHDAFIRYKELVEVLEGMR